MKGGMARLVKMASIRCGRRKCILVRFGNKGRWKKAGREEGREPPGGWEGDAGGNRASSHLSKTRNTYARKIDDVLVGVLMTREMDVRTETLYILRGGKNIMYYTLLRRASLTPLSLTLPPPRSPSWRKGGAYHQPPLLLLEFSRKKCVTSCSLQKGDVILVCKGLKMFIREKRRIKLSGSVIRAYLYPFKSKLCKLWSTFDSKAPKYGHTYAAHLSKSVIIIDFYFLPYVDLEMSFKRLRILLIELIS